MRRIIYNVPVWLTEFSFALGMLLDKSLLFDISIGLGALIAVVYSICFISGKISIEFIRERSALVGVMDCLFSFFVGFSCYVTGYDRLGVLVVIFGVIQLVGQIPNNRTN